MDDQACATPAHEIAEHLRKCWAPDCDKTNRLDWCGWRYCIPHFWTYVLRDAVGWRGKLTKLRWTRIVLH